MKKQKYANKGDYGTCKPNIKNRNFSLKTKNGLEHFEKIE
jgi:hypothetical protein